MSKKRHKNSKGFTLTELMTTMTISVIVILGLGSVLVNSQRGWSATFNRIYSDVIVEGHAARKLFDGVIRNASNKNILLGSSGSWVEVSFYKDSDSTQLDRYARFHISDDQLMVTYGRLNPRAEINTQKICGNVSSCVFSTAGTSVQMILKLDNGSEKAMVMTSATAHNY